MAVVYRSPSVPMQRFVQLMTRVLKYASVSRIATIVAGDVNDDALCTSGSVVERLMLSHGYTQLVSCYNRSIDHAYHHYKQCSGVKVQVCDVYYSDHDVVWLKLLVIMLS